MKHIRIIAMASAIASIGLLTYFADSAYAGECAPVTFAEITYNQGSAPATEKVRLETSAAADPEQALKSFQRAVNYFGQANIISSRVVMEVACFDADSAQLKMLREGSRKIQGVGLATPTLCGNSDGVFECDAISPDNSYPYGNQDSCSVTNRTGFVSYACPDSGLIVTREGDVVLSVNANHIREEVLARTEALRRAVGDANLLTNLHFDIFISPEHQAAVVGNEAFNDLARQLREASDMGQPLPNIQDLLDTLPQAPQNVEFFKQLKEAHARRQQRLETLAHLSNGDRLSPQQLEAFHRDFIGKSQLIDRLIIENTVESLTQAADAINATIQQLMLADPDSTVYEQIKAAARALLEAHTNQGIFDPEARISITPPGDRFLTDEDLEKKLMAADRMIRINEGLRGPGGQAYVDFVVPVFGLMLRLMEEDKMDEAFRAYDKLDSLEFFIEHDDPTGTRFDVHLNPNAQAMFQIDVEPTSSAAYDVTVLLNEVADYHQATGKITVDYQAIIMVNARAALSTADAIRQLYHTEEAYTWFGIAAGFLGGMLENFGGTASGVFYMALNPVDTLQGLKAMIVNWDDTLTLVWQQGADIIHNWPNMSAQEKANLAGQIAAEIALSLPARARQAGRLSEAAQDAVRLHMEKARHGLKLIERTGVALSPQSATQLAHRMEKLGVTSYDEMVNILDGLDEYLPCSLVNRSLGSSIGALAFKVPCPANMHPREFEKITDMLSSQIRGVAPEKHDATLRAILDGQLRKLSGETWISPEGLHYGRRNNGENSLLHMLQHGEDDVTKPIHGVFAGGRDKAPRIVDISFGKILRRPADVKSILSSREGQDVYKTYIVDMRSHFNLNNPVGVVGGGNYRNRENKLKACFMQVVIKNGTVLETAFPFRSSIYKCDGDPNP